MKLSRILSYGIAGIIAGLLFENEMLRKKQKAYKKSEQERKADEETRVESDGVTSKAAAGMI